MEGQGTPQPQELHKTRRAVIVMTKVIILTPLPQASSQLIAEMTALRPPISALVPGEQVAHLVLVC